MKKPKKINKKVIIILSVILLIIIIATTLFLVLKNKDNDKQEPEMPEGENPEFVTEIDMTDTENSEIREDGLKVNTSEKIAEGIEFNDFKIEDITIESSGDMAVFNAKVENPYEKDIEEYIIYITFLRKDGSEIAKVETLFPAIPAGETGYISATTPKDIATAYEIKIERDMR